MMSGKAISKTLRGHFLVEAALVNKLVFALIPCESDESSPDDVVNSTQTDGEENAEDVEILTSDVVKKIYEVYKGIFEGSMLVSEVAELDEVLKFEQCLEKYKALLARQSPTAKLWLHYIEYRETLKLFIRAERTGNWSLHLVAVTRMLNLFAATGHINYAKSARLYLQFMLELPQDYPWLHEMFSIHGFHAVRRSTRY